MVTIKEIAENAGVSSSTVSRILNSDESLQVNPETRQRVLTVAEKLNYIGKDPKAKKLLGNIAITNWYTKEVGLTDLFLRSIRWGIETSLKNAKYSITRSIFNEGLPDASTIDGIIAVGSYHNQNLQKLKNLKKPLVVINQDTLKHDVSCVTIDFVYSVRRIIEHFEKNQHQKIGMIEGKTSYETKYSKEDPRATVFRNEMSRRNSLDESLIFQGDFSIESGYTAMKKAILELGKNLPTAFFIMSDTMAVGAIRALQEHDIAIPNDVSIIGFGNLEVGNYITPKLSTIGLNPSQMGLHGSLILQNIITGVQTTPINVVTGTDLIIRET